MTITLYSEATAEAQRLSRVLKRDVEAKPIDCSCDYTAGCFYCAGSGTYYELVFAFCEHVVQDGDDEACIESDCEHNEYLAAIEREEALEVVNG